MLPLSRVSVASATHQAAGAHLHSFAPHNSSSSTQHAAASAKRHGAAMLPPAAAALPKVGVVAMPPDAEAMAAPARLPPQHQQQPQSVQAAAVVGRRVISRRPAPLQLQQQQQQQQQPPLELSSIQQATRQQQQELWQAQQVRGSFNRQSYPQQQQQQPYDAAPVSPYGGRNMMQQQQQPRAFQPSYDPQQQQQYQQRQIFRQPRQGGNNNTQQQGSSQAPYYPQQQQQQQQRRPPARPQQQQQYGYQQQQQQQQQQRYANNKQQQQWDSPSYTSSNQATTCADDSSTSNNKAATSTHQVRFSHGLKQDWSTLPTGLAVTYLGSSSGSPTRDRNVSCTVLRLPEALYLVDCGEGSSRQAKLTGLPLEQVDALFITHLHGDHCFGIGTMLVSMCRARKAAAAASTSSSSSGGGVSSGGEIAGPDSPDALRVFGPPRVGELVSSMLHIAGVGRQLDQPLYITEFVESHLEAHDWEPLPAPASASSSSASSAPSSACAAFIRRMAPTQQLDVQDWPPGLTSRLDRTGLYWKGNKRGFANWEAKPGLLWQIPCRHAMVTAAQLQHRVPCWGYVFDEVLSSQPTAAGAANTNTTTSSSSSSDDVQLGRRVVLLGDTVDSRPIAPVAFGADLVSHEATFAAGMEGKAAMAQHSTAWMAGQFAWAIQAKALVLTHFSARYEGTGLRPTDRGGGGGGGRGGQQRGGGYGGGASLAEEREAEERTTTKALQREADDQYGLGPVLLAIDLLTAHVPNREQQGDGVRSDSGGEGAKL